MHNRDESIPLAPSMEPVRGRKRMAVPNKVDKRVFYLSLQAIFNALLIGFVARGLVYLIDLITNLAFYGRFSLAPASPAENHLGFAVVLVPILGSLLVGLIARFGSRAIRGHGIPEAMEKIIVDESRIPPAITWLKPLSAAISIGTGGPFGAEGPIIATGGAFGSFTGQLMHISPTERKIMLSAGACAGMAAIFGSPLAAVLLAIELLLFEFSARSIIPVALACVTGAAMHIWLFSSGPVFNMAAIPVAGNEALLMYVLMGLLIGVIASAVSRSVYAVEDLFERLPIHWMWWPAIGAIAVGVTGYFAPFTMGVGYENIGQLLNGHLPLTMLLSLCLLKYISWVISLGSGTSGGTLAPLLTIGGATGALIGLLLMQLFPSAGINLATAALVGMAAMFAGASRALLTSIVFALETTGQLNGLLPLLGACVAAYFVSFFLMKGTIMTEKIRRRGVSTPGDYEPDLLRHTRVKELLTPVKDVPESLPSVNENDDLGLCITVMGQYAVSSLLVTDQEKQGTIKGMVTAAAIMRYYGEQQQAAHRYAAPARTKRWMVRTRNMLHKISR
jgi:chloride channel protein, CIC family